eukprot:g14065.t1
MGNSDAMFGLFKAAGQALCGDLHGARKSTKNFCDGNPIALGVIAVHKHMTGRHLEARRHWETCGRKSVSILNGIADAVPGIGHAKGLIHYACGDDDRGAKAMKDASRSTAAFSGAVAGFVLGNVPGAVAGYATGATSADGVISSVDSAVHGKEKLHGNVAKVVQLLRDPTVGNGIELAIGVGMDVVGGMVIGAGIGEALGGGGEAGASAEVAEPVRGENLPFVGDDIKFLHDMKDIAKTFSEGGYKDGMPKAGELGKDIVESIPDDLKIEFDPSVGETISERAELVTGVGDAEIKASLALALIPDSKRDLIQDVE